MGDLSSSALPIFRDLCFCHALGVAFCSNDPARDYVRRIAGARRGAGAIVNIVFGIGFLILVAPWYFRWVFICNGLLFGRRRMALAKDKEIAKRIEQLGSR
ncbi:MAG TPA: hypothetical protein ENK63_01670 [Rhodobacterales bacterium]|nr:hypothetical protein [Rhodobacterales bacterium]